MVIFCLLYEVQLLYAQVTKELISVQNLFPIFSKKTCY